MAQAIFQVKSEQQQGWDGRVVNCRRSASASW